MRKLILPIVVTTLVFTIKLNAQVGINIPYPTSTLDITAKNATGTTTHVDGLLIPRVDRNRAQSMTSIPTSTLIYINSVATGLQTGTAVNIDTVGYYYYNGTAWTKLIANSSNFDIYNSNGTLTGNRIVSQAANTLAFTGTKTNAFSVAGHAFSVDAANNRVGIGTIAPSAILSVLTPSAGDLIDALSVGINNCGIKCAQGSARNITIFNANATNSVFGGIEFIPSTSATGLSGASITGIDRDVTNNYAGLQFFTRNSTGFGPRITLKASGNVGIGTSTPERILEVNANTTPIRFTNLEAAKTGSDVLTIDSTGDVKRIPFNNMLAGPQSLNYIFSDYSASGNESVIWDGTGTAITITLPTPNNSQIGKSITIVVAGLEDATLAGNVPTVSNSTTLTSIPKTKRITIFAIAANTFGNPTNTWVVTAKDF